MAILLPHHTQYALIAALTLPAFAPQREGYFDHVIETARKTIATAFEQRKELDDLAARLHDGESLGKALSQCALVDREVRFLLACDRTGDDHAGAQLATQALNFLRAFGQQMDYNAFDPFDPLKTA